MKFLGYKIIKLPGAGGEYKREPVDGGIHWSIVQRRLYWRIGTRRLSNDKGEVEDQVVVILQSEKKGRGRGRVGFGVLNELDRSVIGPFALNRVPRGRELIGGYIEQYSIPGIGDGDSCYRDCEAKGVLSARVEAGEIWARKRLHRDWSRK
jgi:hypothetical protein